MSEKARETEKKDEEKALAISSSEFWIAGLIAGAVGVTAALIVNALFK